MDNGKRSRKKRRLGPRRAFRPDDVRTMHDHYPTLGLGVAKLLVDKRTPGAIRRFACKHGLHVDRKMAAVARRANLAAARDDLVRQRAEARERERRRAARLLERRRDGRTVFFRPSGSSYVQRDDPDVIDARKAKSLARKMEQMYGCVG